MFDFFEEKEANPSSLKARLYFWLNLLVVLSLCALTAWDSMRIYTDGYREKLCGLIMYNLLICCSMMMWL